MGYGDDIMASGLARGLATRGKRAAFGDRKKIIWGPWSEEIFRRNPNIARPGEEQCNDLEWIPHYKGHRMYNKLGNGHWVWDFSFKPVPGEIFFTQEELKAAERVGSNFILIEPNVPWQKSVAVNKDWGLANYYEVAGKLKEDFDVVQFAHGRDHMAGIRVVRTHGFRDALAILARASLAIVPEGGLHHGAAAVGTRAVVLFGGFIPPQVTGYDTHINLTGGEPQFCGSLYRCAHCRAAMDRISVEEVYKASIHMMSHPHSVPNDRTKSENSYSA